MRRNFDTDVMTSVMDKTGLSGDELAVLTGTVYITAELGKIPTRVDLLEYLGMAENTYNALMRIAIPHAWERSLKDWFSVTREKYCPKSSAVIYALAAAVVMEGVFLDSGYEPIERSYAREWLGQFVIPQLVQSRATFGGFLIAIEYLETKVRGCGADLTSFISFRYGIRTQTRNYLNQFSTLLWIMNQSEMFDTEEPIPTDMLFRRLGMMVKSAWQKYLEDCQSPYDDDVELDDSTIIKVVGA